MMRNLARIGRFLRRWKAFAVPLGVVLLATVFTMVTHSMQTDDVTDHDFLNPASHAAAGGATLAGQLTAHGVTVITEHGGNQALVTAELGDATLFVPAPSLLNYPELGFLTQLPASITVVVVAPDDDTIDQTNFSITSVRTHWSTQMTSPACAEPTANDAGDAGVDATEYRGAMVSCYHGSLARLQDTTPTVWVVGASDVFRNDRIGEGGNEALANGLLNTHPRLIWLDIHAPEPPPVVRTGVPDDSATSDTVNEGGGSGGGRNARDNAGDGGNANQPGSPQHSIARLFPAWLWTTIGLAALILAVLAVAASRRMGPPVSEPMPVTARLRESVEGRGRLYRRAKQPAVALDVLRRAAIRQLPALLGVPATTPVATMIDMVADVTGLTHTTVDGILREDRPRDNTELVKATRRLDDLMELLSDSVGATAKTHHGTDPR